MRFKKSFLNWGNFFAFAGLGVLLPGSFFALATTGNPTVSSCAKTLVGKVGSDVWTGEPSFGTITGTQVLAAIVNHYDSKFGLAVRSHNHASDFDVTNVPSFTATVGGVSNVQVTFSGIAPQRPAGKATKSNALEFKTAIHHQGFQTRQIGVLTLIGFADDTVLTSDNASELLSFNNVTSTLTVANGVTVVAGRVFLPGTTDLAKNLVVPTTLKEVEAFGFSSYNKLNDVNLQNVRYVGTSAFVNAPLTKLLWPNVHYVGANAFLSAQLQSLVIPNGVTKVMDNAFLESRASGNVAIPNSLTSIGDRAFQNARFTNVSFDAAKSQLVSVGLGAFASSRVTTLVLPKSLVTLGNYAFQDAPLTSVSLGGNLQTIGDEAFASAQVTSLVVPASVISVGDDAFASAPLSSLVVQNGNGNPCQLATIGARAFANANLKSFVVVPSLKLVKEGAFFFSPVDSLTFEGEYRDSIVLQNNSFAHTPPSSVHPDEWRQIALKYPNAFAPYHFDRLWLRG